MTGQLNLVYFVLIFLDGTQCSFPITLNGYGGRDVYERDHRHGNGTWICEFARDSQMTLSYKRKHGIVGRAHRGRKIKNKNQGVLPKIFKSDAAGVASVALSQQLKHPKILIAKGMQRVITIETVHFLGF